MTWTRLKAVVVALPQTPGLLLAQQLVRQVPFRPVDIGKLCFLRLERVPDVPAAMLRGNAHVRPAMPDDLDALVRLQDKRALFRERFEHGDSCVVAEVDGAIVGYEWFCEGPVHYESGWGYPIDIPPGFVYAYDAYIDPAHRNTGLWLRFKAYLGEWMTARGKHGVLTFVDYGNWPSLRTHLRFGFEPTESVLALRLVGLKLFKRVRAIGTTTWSYLVCVIVHQAPVLIHHGTRALHVAVVVVRK